MDHTVLSAVSALVGSIIGLSASVATNWVTQRALARRHVIDAEIRKREALYAEFISESSKLAIDALDHSLDDPQTVLSLYALENRIRLCATEPVVRATARVVQWIGQQYTEDNLAPGELKQLMLAAFREPETRDDPLKRFSEVCRRELQTLQAAV